MANEVEERERKRIEAKKRETNFSGLLDGLLARCLG